VAGSAHTAATALGLTTVLDVSKCCGRPGGTEGRMHTVLEVRDDGTT